MKIFHTADWHLGKIVHGVSMIDEQGYILKQFSEYIQKEMPDVIIIAGDIYDRAIPPPEAVQLLNNWLDEIVIQLKIPVIAIAGNHDSPGRLHFGSKLMENNGFYIVGQLEKDRQPVILTDNAGEVHFHLVPFADPSVVRHVYENEAIQTYDDAMKVIVEHIEAKMAENTRHVLVGHAFVTPHGEQQENTSESERPLSIGGVEYVNAQHVENFHYVALGHLHQAHHVRKEHIRYAGSPLKYSISEEDHKKGFYIVDLNEVGDVSLKKINLQPKRDLRTIEGTIDEILQMEINEDYVFVKLLDETPVLSPMEKIRSIFPNAMHVERPFDRLIPVNERTAVKQKKKQSDLELFKSFYEEVKGNPCEEQAVEIFEEVMEQLIQIENETITTTK